MSQSLSVVETKPATSSGIATAFATCKELGRAALMPFITAGYPTLEKSHELLDALVAGGADLIEIGIPFSDPLADGATVQRASQVALEQGTSLSDAYDLVRAFRSRGHATPVVFMGYSNPFMQYGLQRLANDAASVGVDGFIVPDLPLEESDEFSIPLRQAGRDLIFLVAPTSTDQRIREAVSRASGFIYCVSLTGVTGARENLAGDLGEYIARVRSHTNLPLAIGFGISTPEHVREASALADGVVVASALINHIDTVESSAQADAARNFVQAMAEATGKAGEYTTMGEA
ncbi:tryptophan synthase subunit alpha [soil metagenome]